jgi:hypothetical protein
MGVKIATKITTAALLEGTENFNFHFSLVVVLLLCTLCSIGNKIIAASQ